MCELTKPLKRYGNTECFTCGSALHIYQYEASDTQVDKDGRPTNVDVVRYKINGICPNCGRIYDVARNGMGFIITSKLREKFGGSNYVNSEYEKQHAINRSYNEFGYGPTDHWGP